MTTKNVRDANVLHQTTNMDPYECTEACLVAWDDLLVNFKFLPFSRRQPGDSLTSSDESSGDLVYQAFNLIDLATNEPLSTAGDDLLVKIQFPRVLISVDGDRRCDKVSALVHLRCPYILFVCY